jgi:dihydrofolate synthase/folylpolyglutamate synthase
VKFDELRPIASQMGDFLRNRYFLEVMGEEVLIESPLIGRHQVRNIALAIAAAVELNDCGFSIGPQQIAEGVRQTRWPGRFQLIPGTSARPDIYLDVAHNPAGVWALRSTISEQLGERPLTIIFGAMRDKAIAEMADILFPLADRVILTQAQNAPRAAKPDELRQTIRGGEGLESEATVQAAIERAVAETPHNGAIVISGSIYLVGEALSLLQNSSANAPASIHS